MYDIVTVEGGREEWGVFAAAFASPHFLQGCSDEELLAVILETRMRTCLFLFLSLLLIYTSTLSAAPDFGFDPHRKLKGVYWIYAGDLGDPVPPTAKDKKVMFSIEGQAARELFEALGPDKKDLCTEGSGTRVRARDNDRLFCMRSAKGEYSCNFGFDLRNGKSIGGSIC